MSKHSIAIDLDGTLAQGRYDPKHPDTIGPPCWRARMLLQMLKKEKYEVVLFTGRIDEECQSPSYVVEVVQKWLEENDLVQYVDRIWPHPKPSVRAFVDDRGIRWTGDPELASLEIASATRWVESQKCQ